jgi:hypothetical protein
MVLMCLCPIVITTKLLSNCKMKRKYSAFEIFGIFKEEHRLCSPLDFMADSAFDLRFDSKIWEWRACRDLLEWEELSDYLNQEFSINITRKEWSSVFNPDDKNSIGDVCNLIAKHALFEEIEPIKILGSDCLSASIFRTLRKNLKSKGVNVDSLKPSSNISPYLEKYFGAMMEVILLTGVKVFDKLDYSREKQEKIMKYFWDKYIPRYRRVFDTGEIVTFRDLVLKIMDNKKTAWA